MSVQIPCDLLKKGSYYMDGYLENNLKVCKKIVNKDWDMCFVIDGGEGCGKSVLAQQVAYYFDPTICIERVVFRASEFKEAVLNAKPKQCIIWDEALSGLASRNAMTETNKTIVSLLAEIRQKNLYFIIVLPTFFDLDKYAAIWRSRFLIHVHHERFQRGYFRFFNEKDKKRMYILGKKFYDYKGMGKVKPSFKGRFTNNYTIDEDDYRKKKLESLRAEGTEEQELNSIQKRHKKQRDLLLSLFYTDFDWDSKRIKKEVEKYGVEFMSLRDIDRYKKLLSVPQSANNTTFPTEGGDFHPHSSTD